MGNSKNTDYKRIIELKKRDVSKNAIASQLKVKWDTVNRTITRCVEHWGSVEAVPGSITNEEIAEVILFKKPEFDSSYLFPDV